MSDERTPDLRPFPKGSDARIERIYHQWRQGRLREPGLIRKGPNGLELDVMVELCEGADLPSFVRTSPTDRRRRVHRATVAIEHLEQLSGDKRIRRMEAPRRLYPQLAFSVPSVHADKPTLAGAFPAAPTGSGVVVGIVDVGCDIAHPNVCNADGTTRILHLWRQGAPPPAAGAATGVSYGQDYDSAVIDAALKAGKPYGSSMGGVTPPSRSHGTHVMDIAAGNGLAEGSHPGVAHKADIIFVDVAPHIDRWQDLGDSSRLVDAVSYVFEKAEAHKRPAVVNVSLGANGGAHDGASLVDIGFNDLLDRPGRALVVAAGNAFEARCHASGQVSTGGSQSLSWIVQPNDATGNELEIWYVGGPLEVFVTKPGSALEHGPVQLDGQPGVFDFGGLFCRVHHKSRDPATGLNQIDIVLDWPPLDGAWTIRLSNPGTTSAASYDAWIERDDQNANQSVFAANEANQDRTLSTLACGARTIVVGAYSSGQVGDKVAGFSSAGPTRLQGHKPDVTAPGQFDDTRGVQAACATTAGVTGYAGTSQAAPHVTGVIALMMEAASRAPTADELRQILIASADAAPNQTLPWDGRAGGGRIDAVSAIKSAQNL